MIEYDIYIYYKIDFDIKMHIKRNHLSIYIIKQDNSIYVAKSRPNDWTEWADIFCGHSWVAG